MLNQKCNKLQLNVDVEGEVNIKKKEEINAYFVNRVMKQNRVKNIWYYL